MINATRAAHRAAILYSLNDPAECGVQASHAYFADGLLLVEDGHISAVGLDTDVGAGTRFSILQTLNEAYKVMQLQGAQLHPFKALYLATLGGARALCLDDRIGSLQAGLEADFVVLDYHATPLLSYRLAQSRTIEETLFVLMTLGDDRVVRQTWSAGQKVHERDASPIADKMH